MVDNVIKSIDTTGINPEKEEQLFWDLVSIFRHKNEKLFDQLQQDKASFEKIERDFKRLIALADTEQVKAFWRKIRAEQAHDLKLKKAEEFLISLILMKYLSDAKPALSFADKFHAAVNKPSKNSQSQQQNPHKKAAH